MQLWIIFNGIFYVLVIGFVVLLLYAMFSGFNRGSVRRKEQSTGKREKDGYRVMAGSYGYDASYAPGNRASSAGPFPVGGRTERAPKSFGDYSRTRRRESDE